MGFTKAHGLAIAANGYVQNMVVERRTDDPALTEAGKLWFRTDLRVWKCTTLSALDAVIDKTFYSEEEMSAWIDTLAAETAGTSGASLVGYDGQTGANGKFSTTAGPVDGNLDAITLQVDVNAQGIADLAAGGVQNVQDEVDAIETSWGTYISGAGVWVAPTTGATTTNYMDDTASLTAALIALDAGLATEVSDRGTAVSNEVSRATGIENTINALLTTTISNAGLVAGTAAYSSTGTYIAAAGDINEATELLDAQVVINTGAISDEVSRATGVEATLLPLAGGTMTGDIDMSSQKITNVGTPGDGGDAANKSYVDTVAQGLDPKESVRLSTAAILDACTYANGAAGVGATLTGDANGVMSDIDGVSPVNGDRVLVKTQGAGLQNGIYEVTSIGVAATSPFILTRAIDFDGSPANEVTPGCFTFTEEGTLNANNGFAVTTDGAITIGTTAIAFGQFSGAGSVIAGVGLSKDGNQIDANLGAGIVELPSDEIGIDVYTTGGLITTLDGSATSTGAAAQLAIKLNAANTGGFTNTLSVDASGLKLDNEVSTEIARLGSNQTSIEAGSGLEANGDYTQVAGRTHIGSSTSLHSATLDLDTALDTEISDRGTADTTLSGLITDEENARILADTNLGTEVDAIETSWGTYISSAGVWVAPTTGGTTTNYMDDTASLTLALIALDTAIDALDTSSAAATTAVDDELEAVETALGAYVSNTTGAWVAPTGGATNYLDDLASMTASLVALDTQLKTTTTGLATEVSDRGSADSALDTNMGNIETACGLNSDGTFNNTPVNSGTYVGSAASVPGALLLLDTNLGLVQDELDDTQAGAGLNTDGTYSQDSGKTHIGSATTIHQATQALDLALDQEITDRGTADTAINVNITAIETALGSYVDNADGTWNAPVSGTNYMNGLADLTATLIALDTQIKDNETAAGSGISGVQGELDDTQVGAGLSTLGAYTVEAGSNYLKAADFGATTPSINEAVKLLDVAIDANATAITNEASTRSTNDGTLQTAIDTAEAGAGLTIAGAYNTSTTANYLKAADFLGATLDENIHNATILLDTQAKANADGLASEISRATGAEGANTTAIGNEVTRATGAEGVIAAELLVTQTTGCGINNDGTYTANASTEYLKTSTSLVSATEDLDAQVLVNTNAVSTLKSDLNAQVKMYESAANTTHSFTHNLNTNYVSCEVWVKDDDDLKYRNDLVGITIDSVNALTIDLTESKAVRVIIRKAVDDLS